MNIRLLCTLLALALASPVAGAQVIVFKKDGRYRGAGIPALSVETAADGRLLIRGIDGALLSADANEVDWQASGVHTARYQALELEAVERRRLEAEAAARAAQQAAAADRKTDNLVEASRRFGVDNPAMTVSSGSAVASSSTAYVSPAARKQNELRKEAGKLSARDITMQLAMAESNVRQAQAEAKAIEEKLAQLRADTNTDPVSASLRNSQIERRTKELEATQGRIAEAQKGVERVKALAEARSSGQ